MMVEAGPEPPRLAPGLFLSLSHQALCGLRSTNPVLVKLAVTWSKIRLSHQGAGLHHLPGRFIGSGSSGLGDRCLLGFTWCWVSPWDAQHSAVTQRPKLTLPSDSPLAVF